MGRREEYQLSGIDNGNISRFYSSRVSRQTRGELMKRALTSLEVAWNNAQQVTRLKASPESV